MKVLPEEMREELKRPFGKLYPNEEFDRGTIEGELKDKTLLITCGDESSLKIHQLGIKIDIAIIDFKTKREEIKERERLMNIGTRSVNVKNPAGTITEELEDALKAEIDLDHEGTTLIIVDGEEDMAFIPCVLYSPDGSVVMYGQPDEGLVVAVVNDALRARIQDIYDRMEKND